MTKRADCNNSSYCKPKGPVIGPLVVCAFAAPESSLSSLKSAGVKDSKLLTPEKREALARELRAFPHALAVVTAREITEEMARKVSLNEVEARFMASVIQAVVEKVGFENVARIMVDSPDPTTVKFKARLRKYYDADSKVHCEHKADLRYTEVGAASILAKVLRDAEVAKIKELFGEDFGTGYSHDAATIAFLKKHLRDPRLTEFVRWKWSTAKKLRVTQLELNKFL